MKARIFYCQQERLEVEKGRIKDFKNIFWLVGLYD
jgi:hypothetical protein